MRGSIESWKLSNTGAAALWIGLLGLYHGLVALGIPAPRRGLAA